MPQGTKINGKDYDFTSIETDAVGFKFDNVVEINFQDEVDLGVRRNRKGKVSAVTHGEYSAEGDITLPLADSMELLKELWEMSNQKGVVLVEFPLTVSYANGDDPTITQKLAVRIQANESSNAQGNDATNIKHKMFVREIVWDGGVMLSNL